MSDIISNIKTNGIEIIWTKTYNGGFLVLSKILTSNICPGPLGQKGMAENQNISDILFHWRFWSLRVEKAYEINGSKE